MSEFDEQGQENNLGWDRITMMFEDISRHSPTPWRINPEHLGTIMSADGLEVASTNDGHDVDEPRFQDLALPVGDAPDANTALIVRAVNNHAHLVAMLQKMIEASDNHEICSQAQIVLDAALSCPVGEMG